MRIRLSGIVLASCVATVSAGPLLATPMSTAAAASVPVSHAPAHPVA
jgi:hypothetical protein